MNRFSSHPRDPRPIFTNSCRGTWSHPGRTSGPRPLKKCLIIGSSHLEPAWLPEQETGIQEATHRPRYDNPLIWGYHITNFSRGGRSAERMLHQIIRGEDLPQDPLSWQRRSHRDFHALRDHYYSIVVCLGGNDYSPDVAGAAQFDAGRGVANQYVVPIVNFLRRSRAWLSRTGKIYTLLPPPRSESSHPGHDQFLRGLERGLRDALPTQHMVQRVSVLYADSSRRPAHGMVWRDGTHLSDRGYMRFNSGVIRCLTHARLRPGST